MGAAKSRKAAHPSGASKATRKKATRKKATPRKATPGKSAPRSPEAAEEAEPLALPATCALAGAADLCDLAGRALASGSGSVEVDAGSVKQVDTATLQILVVLARDLAAAGRELCFASVSDEFARGARLLGLCAALDLPEPEPQHEEAA